MLARVHRSSQGGSPPKFLEYQVFCVFRGTSQAKYCCSPKNKHFAPQHLGWLRHCARYPRPGM